MYTPCASVGAGVAAASALAVPSAMRDVLIHMGVPPSVTSQIEHDGAYCRSSVLVLFSDRLAVASSPTHGGCAVNTKTYFAFRVVVWDGAGDNIVEHALYGYAKGGAGRPYCRAEWTLGESSAPVSLGCADN